jgi:hypothetical protein
MCNNISKPTLDWSKPWQTMDGQDAKLISDNYRTSCGLKRLVQIEFLNYSTSFLYDQCGTLFNKHSTLSPDLTLRNKTRKVTKWYNLYRSGPGGLFYTTREDANHRSNHALDLLEIRKIEIEEPL